MVPWSITRVTDLPPNAKLREMQQNTHGLVQLIRAATPDVPQLSKQMLNACPLPPMHMIARLLPGRQSSILCSTESKSMGQSISPTGKGPVHIPNWKGAMQKAWIRAPYQKWPKKMPNACPAH